MPADPSASGRMLYTGQVVIDLAMVIDALPPPGGDILTHQARFEVGGGFNVMAAARRSGMPVHYLGCHGEGRFGEMARHGLRDEGIAFGGAPIPGTDTGCCVALTDATGERTFISYVGAESAQTLEDLARITPQAGDFVCLSGYSLFHASKRAVLEPWLLTLPAGVELVFDPGPLSCDDDPGLAALLARVTLWSGNRDEAVRAAGTEDMVQAMAVLAARLAPSSRVLLRDGANGCWCRDRDGTTTHVDGFPITVVDTNGAGDAHTGVFVAGLAAGLGAREAAHRANAAAAIAVTRYGPATAPTRSEIDAFLAEPCR